MKKYKSKYTYRVSFVENVKPPYEVEFLNTPSREGRVVTLETNADFTFQEDVLYTEAQLFKEVLVKTDKINKLVNDPTK